jgi:hypothetical protein
MPSLLHPKTCSFAQSLWILSVIGLVSSPTTACETTPLDSWNLAEELDGKRPDIEIVVADVQSVEGGEWTVYFRKDNSPGRILRIDYGETGQWEAKLDRDYSNKPGDYLITLTKRQYIANFGSVIREEIDYYFFCDGKLQVPAEPVGIEVDYQKSAKAAANTFFNAPEIQQTIKAAKLERPTW